MCDDLLPECVNAFLDDLETGLCLPILLMIVLCTLQFVLNHTMDITCTIASATQGASCPLLAAPKPNACKASRYLPEKLKGVLLQIGTSIGVYR